MTNKQSLLNRDSFASIHIKNMQRLSFEMFKFDKGLSPPIMDNIFNFETENLSQVV